MIFLWGLPNDPSTRAVCDYFARWRTPAFFLNPAEVFRTRVTVSTKDSLSFRVTVGPRTCCLDDVTAAYLRPYNYRDYPGAAGTDQTATADAALVHHLISAWAEYTPALVVSRPSSEGTNQSKLYQAAEIRAAGFLTPESLVSTDPAAIREFRACHGRLIYKSMSSVRSIVRELAAADLDLGANPLGPTLFQQFIEGQNVRVHVVGPECFACAIETTGADYRYAPSQMASRTLPSTIAERCVALSRRLGLTLAGLDLIRTPAGDWYCLEVNPNPAFMSFPAGDQVARALAHVLLKKGTDAFIPTQILPASPSAPIPRPPSPAV